jgi:hypothetical protein
MPMPEQKGDRTTFSLTREEASAVMGWDMRVKITPHMQSILDSVQKKAIEAGFTGYQVVAVAALTDGVLPGLSFDENFFKTPKEFLDGLYKKMSFEGEI